MRVKVEYTTDNSRVGALRDMATELAEMCEEWEEWVRWVEGCPHTLAAVEAAAYRVGLLLDEGKVDWARKELDWAKRTLAQWEQTLEWV